ncbi:helix-turn-helix domain-containing protein [Microbacterium sp. NPDC056044]|uniref:helix-turn-helix domain-containing protein n=1 Tax=Microbacterium sp. NPDC056044 TaxID=3345690 RepID=UPI0035D817E1
MRLPQIPHGSPAGYDLGCRGRGQCAFQGSPDYLTCVEAATARRADFAVSRLPPTQPLLRESTTTATLLAPEHNSHRTGPVHGTTWGYQRGCRSNAACPNWRRGGVTCTEARRRYIAEYGARRVKGGGATIAHGTSNGYLLGCRDTRSCPGDARGKTCSTARAEYRRDLARAAGIPPRPESIDSAEATRLVRRLLETGLSIRQIARAAGCGRTTIADVADPKRSNRTRVSLQTMRKIVAAAVRANIPLSDAGELSG